MNFHFGAGRKYGIQVRGNGDYLFFIGAAQFADDVSGLVDLRLQSGFGKQHFDSRAALRFLKRWRGDLGDTNLLVIHPGNIRSEPIERGADSRVVGKP